MSPLSVTIILYITIVIAVIVTKPKFIFENPNIYNKFGLKTTDIDNKTIVPLWLIMLVFATVLYFVVLRLMQQKIEM